MFLVLDHTLALFAICNVMLVLDRSHRERGLRQESAVVCLLKFAGSNAAGGMDVCLGCCVLSGRNLYEGLIPRPEESYRLWCVIVSDLEKSRMRRPSPALGCGDGERKFSPSHWLRKLGPLALWHRLLKETLENKMCLYFVLNNIWKRPVPVAERSKAQVYGRSLAGIAGSNPAKVTNGCPF